MVDFVVFGNEDPELCEFFFFLCRGIFLGVANCGTGGAPLCRVSSLGLEDPVDYVVPESTVTMEAVASESTEPYCGDLSSGIVKENVLPLPTLL